MSQSDDDSRSSLSHDPDHFDLAKGHSCTDVPCCVVFLVSIAAFCFLYWWSLTTGDIKVLIGGINANGEVCGIDNRDRVINYDSQGASIYGTDKSNQPYMAWCVKPTSDGEVEISDAVCVLDCNDPPVCENGMSAPTQMKTYGHYCLPADSEEMASRVLEEYIASPDEKLKEGFASIAPAYGVYIISFFLALVLGYLYLGLLRYFAGCLIWTLIFGCIVGFGGIAAYLFLNAGNLSDHFDVNVSAETLANEEKHTKILAGVFAVISLVFVLVALCFCQSIRAATGCVQATCEALWEMPTLLLWPGVFAIIKTIFSCVLLYGFLMLWSHGDVTSVAGTPYRVFTHTKDEYVLILAYMLVAFWILAFMTALYQFTMAWAGVTFYKTPYEDGVKDVNGFTTAVQGLRMGLTVHCGSLALGSFIVAVLEVIQKVIEYAEKKNQEGGGNPVLSAILKCLLCVTVCVKEIIKYINKNAYIDIALRSSGFCTAAKHVMQTILEIGGAMAILNGATYAFTLFGTALITLACAVMGYFAVQDGAPFEHEDILVPYVPAAVAGLIGFLVAMSFMEVFDMTSDTLLYCYGSDLHTGASMAHAPAAIQKLVSDHHDHNKKESESEDA